MSILLFLLASVHQLDKLFLASFRETSSGFSSLSPLGLWRSSAQFPTMEGSFFQADPGEISTEPALLLAQSFLVGVTCASFPQFPIALFSALPQLRTSSFLMGLRLEFFGFSHVPKEPSSLQSFVDHDAEAEPSLLDHLLSLEDEAPSLLDHWESLIGPDPSFLDQLLSFDAVDPSFTDQDLLSSFLDQVSGSSFQPPDFGFSQPEDFGSGSELVLPPGFSQVPISNPLRVSLLMLPRWDPLQLLGPEFDEFQVPASSGGVVFGMILPDPAR